ncbi:MAG: hypothetical protein TR69_WS6001001267 [candidate division WS6 bacterium OLB20]|uniref:Uncharacterized protein n=1 Tax=candidate division WS6 bacterium OLB20 TaxID=1617426 RepID=A0A136LWE8_9BACT|nr:MAG: hypothetical protein TR69_WS6001001267 [candidate division WS6 bacterium OLB20]
MIEQQHPQDRQYYTGLPINRTFDLVFQGGSAFTTETDLDFSEVRAVTFDGRPIEPEELPEGYEFPEESEEMEDPSLTAMLYQAGVEWIRANASPEDKKLVNAMFSYVNYHLQLQSGAPAPGSAGYELLYVLHDTSIGRRRILHSMVDITASTAGSIIETIPFIAVHHTISDRARRDPVRTVADIAQTLYLGLHATNMMSSQLPNEVIGSSAEWMRNMVIDKAVSQGVRIDLTPREQQLYRYYKEGALQRPQIPLFFDDAPFNNDS